MLKVKSQARTVETDGAVDRNKVPLMNYFTNYLRVAVCVVEAAQPGLLTLRRPDFLSRDRRKLELQSGQKHCISIAICASNRSLVVRI